MRYQPTTSMSSYLAEYFAVVDQLVDLGVTLDDKLISVALLVGLGEAYEMFVIAVTSQDTPPSSAVLKTKLLEEEMRKTTGKEKTSDAAFAIKTTKRRKERRVKCFKCNRFGHIASECKSANRHQDNTTGKSQILSLGSSNDRNLWILDSGATAHVCCDKRYFKHLKSPESNIMSVADGRQIPIIGAGEIEMQ
ncbi:uncharacterized protein LOC112538918, partial [Tetranychus urticae]|uniref:uncharacterized protein LOC112538918 n=1 Tax=Tetranychus urticae TaxID=32264 RepID=UPI000D65B44E